MLYRSCQHVLFLAASRQMMLFRWLHFSSPKDTIPFLTMTALCMVRSTILSACITIQQTPPAQHVFVSCFIRSCQVFSLCMSAYACVQAPAQLYTYVSFIIPFLVLRSSTFVVRVLLAVCVILSKPYCMVDCRYMCARVQARCAQAQAHRTTHVGMCLFMHVQRCGVSL